MTGKPRVLFSVETPLIRCGERFYSEFSWFQFLQHLAKEPISLTIWAPVIDASSAPAGAWEVVLDGIRLAPRPHYRGFVGWAASFPRLWWATRRAADELAASHDLVAMRLPSPVSGILSRAAARAKTPSAVFLSGDMLAQSDRFARAGGIERFLLSVVMKLVLLGERACVRRSSLVYVYNSALLARYRRGSPTLRLTRTPHLSRVEFKLRRSTHVGEPVKLLRVCWLQPSKDIETLLRALAVLFERGLRFQLTILGKEREPGYEARLRGLAVELGVADAVRFLGWQPFSSIRAHYQNADIQIISSSAEGTPRCILEGAAVGLPLVSTDAGGCADVLTPGVDALVVPRGDPGAMADAIAIVASDEPLRRRIIAGGYRAARRESFEVEGRRIASELISIARATPV